MDLRHWWDGSQPPFTAGPVTLIPVVATPTPFGGHPLLPTWTPRATVCPTTTQGMTTMAQLPPAGWHPDPLGRQAQRYWDGQQWTEHVADQAGNMGVDPLEGQAPQAQQQTSGTESWGGGQQQPAPQDWGAQPADQAAGATAAGLESNWGDSTVDAGNTPTDAGQPDAASAMGGAAVGVAAVGAAAATEDDAAHSDWSTATPAASEDAVDGGFTDTTGVDVGTSEVGAAGLDDEATADGETADDAAGWVGGVLAFEVSDDDPVVASLGAVVARQCSVTVTEREDENTIAGTGTVWLGRGGTEVSVITLQDPGLTVDRDALVAHSAGLERTDAHPGIVGFSGLRLSGAGWVALAAPGGLAEIPTADGIEVAATSLVAFTNDLDVSHADTVNIAGPGVALVKAS